MVLSSQHFFFSHPDLGALAWDASTTIPYFYSIISVVANQDRRNFPPLLSSRMISYSLVLVRTLLSRSTTHLIACHLGLGKMCLMSHEIANRYVELRRTYLLIPAGGRGLVHAITIIPYDSTKYYCYIRVRVTRYRVPINSSMFVVLIVLLTA